MYINDIINGYRALDSVLNEKNLFYNVVYVFIELRERTKEMKISIMKQVQNRTGVAQHF